MLCEYRSDDKKCLEIMQAKFEEIFDSARSEKVQVSVKKVGDRPCSNIDFAKVEEIKDIAVPIIKEVIGNELTFKSSSTDCNIPLSLGVPALCVGVNIRAGVHTREEWVDKASLIPGLEIAIKLGKELTEVQLWQRQLRYVSIKLLLVIKVFQGMFLCLKALLKL